MGDFNFVRHYGAEVKEIKRSGVSIVENLSRVKFHEGDTLVLWADDSFISTWGDSSVFVLLANGKDTEPKAGRKKRWFALTLLVLMIVGATVGELPFMEELLPGIDLDMFFFAAVTTVIMAWTKLFRHVNIQIYIMGYLDNHCLCVCYKSRHGKFRSGGYHCAWNH